MKKFLLPLLILIFALGFLIRLYRFDNPIADWHSWRQGDTNAVSAIYLRDGIDLLHPRYFDISNIQSGFDNPHGYRMVEFPIYNALQVIIYKMLAWSGITLVESGRLISIFATLSGAFCVFLLVKKYAEEQAAFFAAFFYLFLPFSIFYGRSILPDPSMTASILAGIYFFDKWLEANSKFKIGNSKLKVKNQKYLILNTLYFILAAVFTALSFLLKPFALFFILPMVYLAFNKWGWKVLKQWQLYLFGLMALLPLVLWRYWIGQFPDGVPLSTWLLNGNGIRFRPSFFRWIFYERITSLIMGYVGIILLAVGGWGLVKNKNRGFFLSFAVSSLIYLIVVASGNVQHDYYQILIVPTLSIFAGLGTAHLLNVFKKNKFLQLQIYVFALLVVLFGWVGVKDFFNINDWGMVAAGQEANRILPKSALVIAPYGGSTALLNIIERPGWPAFQSDIEKLIDMGANYMVLPNPSKADIAAFGADYETVASTSSYFIVKLK